ncbi:MAG: purine nucleoside permease [bacterium]
MMRTSGLLAMVLCIAIMGVTACVGPQPSERFAPKVMVLCTFEILKDTGDQPGEFQFWVERENLTRSLTVPGLDRPLRFNEEGLFAAVIGTTGRSDVQLESLIEDSRFDFSQTYWLMAGIAGVDPEDASIGSAAWVRWVVDGDIAFEIDSREIPSDWPYGILPIGATRPGQQPKDAGWTPKVMAWELNSSLVDWAFSLTGSLTLPDSLTAQAQRAKYTSWPAAQQPPIVLLGDDLGSSRFWHGQAMTNWANDWVSLFTGGQGNFVMTDCEDHNVANSMERSAQNGLVDFDRLLILRSGSNFCLPPPGTSAADSLLSEYSGLDLALESAHRVGSVVVHELLAGWDRYATQVP